MKRVNCCAVLSFARSKHSAASSISRRFVRPVFWPCLERVLGLAHDPLGAMSSGVSGPPPSMSNWQRVVPPLSMTLKPITTRARFGAVADLLVDLRPGTRDRADLRPGVDGDDEQLRRVGLLAAEPACSSRRPMPFSLCRPLLPSLGPIANISRTTSRRAGVRVEHQAHLVPDGPERRRADRRRRTFVARSPSEQAHHAVDGPCPCPWRLQSAFAGPSPHRADHRAGPSTFGGHDVHHPRGLTRSGVECSGGVPNFDSYLPVASGRCRTRENLRERRRVPRDAISVNAAGRHEGERSARASFGRATCACGASSRLAPRREAATRCPSRTTRLDGTLRAFRAGTCPPSSGDDAGASRAHPDQLPDGRRRRREKQRRRTCDVRDAFCAIDWFAISRSPSSTTAPRCDAQKGEGDARTLARFDLAGRRA